MWLLMSQRSMYNFNQIFFDNSSPNPLIKINKLFISKCVWGGGEGVCILAFKYFFDEVALRNSITYVSKWIKLQH